MSKVSIDHIYPFHDEWQNPPQRLKQTFHYLGKGVQFHVFIGEDNQTILKLFKHHHGGLSIDTIKKVLPKTMASALVKRREKRMGHLFSSAKIASTKLQNETGVLYTHLEKTEGILGKTTICDKLGISHPLDLDKTEFVLQKKAETVFQRLDTLFRFGKVDEAISAMKKIQNLIEDRSRKGIKNKDGNVLDNCGFIEDRAIELDIGSFVYRTKSTNPNPHKKAVFRATLQLLGWVKKKYPMHLNACKKELLYENTI